NFDRVFVIEFFFLVERGKNGKIGMSRTAKTFLYSGLVICCAFLAWAYSSQHSLQQRKPPAGSTGLMLVYLIGLIVVGGGLVVLCGLDISRFFGQSARA